MKCTGTGVALITPFFSDGGVDEQSLRAVVDHVTAGGVDFLVALGTTAETAVLSPAEKRRVLEIILDQNAGRLPVVVGIGGNDTQNTVDRLRHFPFADACQAILSVAPYYNKPTQEGLFQHFKTIASASPLPLFLYNVPGRTSVNMTSQTTVRLSHECPNIIGIKEACGDFQQITEILRDMRRDFLFLAGNDELALPEMALGAHGVISVIANLFPSQYAAMVRLAGRGDFSNARKIHLMLGTFYKYLFQEGNPAGVKAGLHIRRVIRDNALRLPLVPAGHALYRTMEEEIRRLDASALPQ